MTADPAAPYLPEIGDRVVVTAHSAAFCALAGKVVAHDDGRETGDGHQWGVLLDDYADVQWFKAMELRGAE